ncbi:uncharacterized protein KGF55_002072 [Candida pseudojiufengensis]|uniref:uncharacterized protein n=1 Tax=Candida pseudojiufengensis TaxID=497109 RepID=UPI00222493BA|nr:uncharacterized protein KGF55_002072 [Candida pseudojiufengensis]KAI5964130.1 hypothetical protein KGF55_002072 [Candida pseudojiufengensis]
MSSSTNSLPIRKSKRIRNLTPKAITNNLNFLVSSNNLEIIEQQQPLKRASEDNTSNNSQLKKRKTSSTIEEEEKLQDKDKIDPVEKLLSLTNINNDFILDLDINESNTSINNHSSSISSDSISSVMSNTSSSKRSSSIQSLKNCAYSYEDSEASDEEYEDEEPIEIESVNFTQILNDNIRNYYKQKSQNQYKDSFTLLNNKNNIYSDNFNVITKDSLNQNTTNTTNNKSSVPFFKNVNFGRSKEYSIEDFVTYGDEEEQEKEIEPTTTATTTNKNIYFESEEDEDPISTTVSPISSPTTSNSNLSISTPPTLTTTTSTPDSIYQIPLSSNLYIPKINNNWLKSQNSSINNNTSQLQSLNESYFDLSNVLKKHSLITASEMVSTGNFMINDFYL